MATVCCCVLISLFFSIILVFNLNLASIEEMLPNQDGKRARRAQRACRACMCRGFLCLLRSVRKIVVPCAHYLAGHTTGHILTQQRHTPDVLNSRKCSSTDFFVSAFITLNSQKNHSTIQRWKSPIRSNPQFRETTVPLGHSPHISHINLYLTMTFSSLKTLSSALQPLPLHVTTSIYSLFVNL